MKLYESNLELRRVNKHRYNGYDTHKSVENLVFEKSGVKTNYTFMSSFLEKSTKLSVRIRTQEPTSLPGEESIELSFVEGQKVQFITRFLPYKNTVVGDAQKTKRVFINDSIDREQKLFGAAERAGLDVESTEELAITKTKFTKSNGNQFYLTDVTFLVEAVITDPKLFEKAYVEGICAKANFGYGMIAMNKDCL